MTDTPNKEITVREFVEQCVLKRGQTLFHSESSPNTDTMRAHAAMLLGYASALNDIEVKPVLSNRQGPFNARIEYITGPEMMRRSSESLNEAANIIELLFQYSGLDV